jgi:small-conductance mechanosensitive channel
MIGLIVTMGIKDYATAMTKGLAFKFFGPFKEGDHVILDGEKAVIVKIGASITVFGLHSKQGYMWRYIPNQRIGYAKLGKVIFDNTNEDQINLSAEQIKQLKEQL